ncbi:MAG: L-histidine N(alpha)-methyltransferase, partial [Candidatus Thiodiazotropha sp. 6PLUC10]
VDYTHSLPVPEEVPNGPRLLFFPGSSLGNFSRRDAAEFLRLANTTLGKGGMLLIGVDTKKSKGLLDAAYNDAAGLTAAFNLNLLNRMQAELNAELNPENFQHKAFYNSDAGRIEMHLMSTRQHILRIDDHQFEFEAGEYLHTENSYKYTPEEFIKMASDCGYDEIKYWVDDDDMFAIYLLQVR